MERRKVNVSFGKNGNGFVTNKITLPVPWVKELGFNDNDRKAIIEFDKNKIIIKKEKINMLLIKNENGKHDHERYDYELENGLLLFSNDWNGEAYIRALDSKTNKWNNNSFKAVYRYDEEDVDISEVEENSVEWDRLVEVVGFEEV
ncbi:MAG: hypothetical protein HFJ17_01635 [Clostridia bacterium]|jgi:bifunctional DNA-binding transcriptional regulator/antitoxin component of YhaV-PrlF toxin-antitoxin module|nr:hypothetical protein [Clostridia bacterium]